MGLLVFFVGVEFWARIDDYLSYGASIWSPYNSESLYTRDSLGKTGKPNARYRKWQMNSLGFRGPELKRGGLRIVCFGASETFGLYEAEGQEYPRQLERLLNARVGRDEVQVVNAAYPGESAFTANIRAAGTVAAVRPRWALIYPTPADYIWIPHLEASLAPASSRSSPHSLHVELRISERATSLLKEVVPWKLQTAIRERQLKRRAANYPVMDTLPTQNVERFRTDVTALVITLRQLGVVPVIVTHASAFGPGEGAADRSMLVAWRKFYPMLREEGFIQMELRMNDALRSIATEQGALLIDAASNVPHSPDVFADFVHFTNKGASIMARVLADGLSPMMEADPR